MIEVGLAEIVTVGADGELTATIVVAAAAPPGPLQLTVYCGAPTALGVTLWLPPVARVPLHASLATQSVASVLDQVNVVDWPSTIEVELADKLTVGKGAVTVKSALAVAEPPEPVQVTVYA